MTTYMYQIQLYCPKISFYNKKSLAEKDLRRITTQLTCGNKQVTFPIGQKDNATQLHQQLEEWLPDTVLDKDLLLKNLFKRLTQVGWSHHATMQLFHLLGIPTHSEVNNEQFEHLYKLHRPSNQLFIHIQQDALQITSTCSTGTISNKDPENSNLQSQYDIETTITLPLVYPYQQHSVSFATIQSDQAQHLYFLIKRNLLHLHNSIDLLKDYFLNESSQIFSTLAGEITANLEILESNPDSKQLSEINKRSNDLTAQFLDLGKPYIDKEFVKLLALKRHIEKTHPGLSLTEVLKENLEFAFQAENYADELMTFFELFATKDNRLPSYHLPSLIYHFNISENHRYSLKSLLTSIIHNDNAIKKTSDSSTLIEQSFSLEDYKEGYILLSEQYLDAIELNLQYQQKQKHYIPLNFILKHFSEDYYSKHLNKKDLLGIADCLTIDQTYEAIRHNCLAMTYQQWAKQATDSIQECLSDIQKNKTQYFYRLLIQHLESPDNNNFYSDDIKKQLENIKLQAYDELTKLQDKNGISTAGSFNSNGKANHHDLGASSPSNEIEKTYLSLKRFYNNVKDTAHHYINNLHASTQLKLYYFLTAPFDSFSFNRVPPLVYLLYEVANQQNLFKEASEYLSNNHYAFYNSSMVSNSNEANYTHASEDKSTPELEQISYDMHYGDSAIHSCQII